MSTPRSLRLPRQVTRTVIATSRGEFAALTATPASGVTEHRPALLVPGYTGSKEDFIAILEPLAAGRVVTAIDMRGQHESAAAAHRHGYHLDELASDLLAVAEAIGGEVPATGRGPRIHLLGHSFGGLVARQAVLASPGAFFSLVLLSSGPGSIGGDRAQALVELLGYLGPASDDTAQLRAMVSTLWEIQLRPQAEADGTPPEIIEFLADRAQRTCPLGLREMAKSLLDCPDRSAELAAIKDLPVLVSYGENDDAWPPDVQEQMAKRLRAERVCIPGAAHSPPVEAPETTAAMLTSFWNHAEPRW